jgi:hypothetical protein
MLSYNRAGTTNAFPSLLIVPVGKQIPIRACSLCKVAVISQSSRPAGRAGKLPQIPS